VANLVRRQRERDPLARLSVGAGGTRADGQGTRETPPWQSTWWSARRPSRGTSTAGRCAAVRSWAMSVRCSWPSTVRCEIARRSAIARCSVPRRSGARSPGGTPMNLLRQHAWLGAGLNA
jgi:hypothetical protein